MKECSQLLPNLFPTPSNNPSDPTRSPTETSSDSLPGSKLNAVAPASYCSEFKEADYLRGRQISVNDASRGVCGVAAGIDAAGALLVDTGGAIERIIGGDVSVRTIA